MATPLLRHTCLVFLAAGVIAAPVAATAGASGAPREACIEIDSSLTWRAQGENTLYVRSRLTEVYRVDLSYGSPNLESPFTRLHWVLKGSSTICSPHDADLVYSDGTGFRKPLRIGSITRLTPEQVQALPAKYRP